MPNRGPWCRAGDDGHAETAELGNLNFDEVPYF